jgi:hypothetical protein
MKNPTRRFTQSEFELLLDALRAHEFFLQHSHLEDMLPEHSQILGRDMKSAIREHRELTRARTIQLRERLGQLFHHDVPLDIASVPDDQKTFCLRCKRRHVPHCSQCPGCLPEELPE